MMQELDMLETQLAGTGFSERMLDLCFILDTTGSMGSYITSATQNIELICNEIIASERLASPECLRVGLIAYRDHPPQDNTYITKSFPFTCDVQEVRNNLNNLYASGGGDGPEAVVAAMKASMDLDWRPQASKMSVLIADAPPHGIGEYGDGFKNGDPTGLDPLHLARQMAQAGISLFVVACEPALSGYTYGTDFFRALTEITSAVLMPLTTASLLPHVIVGSAFEQLNMERLIQEVAQAVAERVHGGQESVDDVARELHEKLMLRNETTKTLVVEDIYRDSEEARHNLSVWLSADSCASAIPHLKRIVGSRFTEKYLRSRYSGHSYARAHPIPLPSRSPVKSPSTYSISPPSTPRTSLSDFKPFTGSPKYGGNTSFGAPTSPTSFGSSPRESFSGNDLSNRSFATPVSPTPTPAAIVPPSESGRNRSTCFKGRSRLIRPRGLLPVPLGGL